MEIVERFESYRIAQLGALNGICFRKFVALEFSCVRQVAFSAALSLMRHNYLFVVLVAVCANTASQPLPEPSIRAAGRSATAFCK